MNIFQTIICMDLRKKKQIGESLSISIFIQQFRENTYSFLLAQDYNSWITEVVINDLLNETHSCLKHNEYQLAGNYRNIVLFLAEQLHRNIII